MKKHLITFGSDQSYHKSFHRLMDSAEGCFDTSTAYGPGAIDPAFAESNKEILSQPRGAGYWLWKPHLILRRLTEVDDGDLVFYTDALLTIDEQKMKNFLSHEASGSSGKEILLFKQDHLNKHYTNFDCFHLMNCLTPEYWNGGHINAAFMGFVKSPNTIKFVKEWLFWCRQPECIMDRESEYGTTHPAFRAHRHDQSILSLLAIKHNIVTLEDMSQWGNSPYGIVINHHRTK